MREREREKGGARHINID